MQQRLMQLLHVTNTRYKNKNIKLIQATNNKQNLIFTADLKLLV